MGSANTVFAVQFGPYDLRLDRTDLTFTLTETATGTVWGTGLPVGWLELASQGRVDFGACRLVSLSEKSGATGKRILFGLEAPGGVPVDVYFTCGPKQIQLTVEASRDTRDARVVRVGLLPGLVASGPDGELVLPLGLGGVLAAGASETEAAQPSCGDVVLDTAAPASDNGLFAAFVGAVRPAVSGRSSGLCVLHDSCYGAARVARDADGWTASWEFDADPERRRLDLRVIVIPDADVVSVARAFRDHRVAERGHVTLRQKGRERPGAIERILAGESAPVFDSEMDFDAARSRWEALDNVQDLVRELSTDTDLPLVSRFPGEWTAAWVDGWPALEPESRASGNAIFGDAWRSFPLLATVWRDAVAVPVRVGDADDFVDALRGLAPAASGSAQTWAGWLNGLYRATFPAFLVGHRMLGQNQACEEWVWSNRTRVWVNRGQEAVTVDSGMVVPGCSWRVEPPVDDVPSGGEIPG